MKEIVKSIILLILFVAALVLTYLNTMQPFFVIAPTQEERMETIPPDAVLRPRFVLYSDGIGNYKRLHDHVRKLDSGFYEKLAGVLSGSETLIRVDKREYVDAFAKQSVMLSSVGLDKKYITKFSHLGSYYCYDEILIGNQAIYVKNDDAYYKVEDASGIDLSVYNDVWEGIEGEVYRRIYDRFSLHQTLSDRPEFVNYHLIPYSQIATFFRYSVKPELNIHDRGEINAVAKSILGERLDFTQIFEDAAHSIVFVYNKGEKSLTFTRQGMLHFRQRPNEAVRTKKADFEQALASALKFIFYSGGIPKDMRMESCVVGEHGEYYFFFVYSAVGKYKVVGEDCGISVIVEGDSVVEMNRKVVFAEGIFASELKSYVPVDQCINNHLYLFETDTKYEKFYYALSQIENIDAVLYLKEGELIPAWEVSYPGRSYLFEMETGIYIESVTEEEEG